MNKMKNQDSLKSSMVVLKHELCMTLRLLFQCNEYRYSTMLDFIISLASLQKPGFFRLRKNTRKRQITLLSRKEMPKYDYVYNQTILYLTLGAFLIGVQTYIPGVVLRKLILVVLNRSKGIHLINLETLRDWNI